MRIADGRILARKGCRAGGADTDSETYTIHTTNNNVAAESPENAPSTDSKSERESGQASQEILQNAITVIRNPPSVVEAARRLVGARASVCEKRSV